MMAAVAALAAQFEYDGILLHLNRVSLPVQLGSPASVWWLLQL